jgi:hypothetical protein
LAGVASVFGIVDAAATFAGAVLGPVLAQVTRLGIAVNGAVVLAAIGTAVTLAVVPPVATQ